MTRPLAFLFVFLLAAPAAAADPPPPDRLAPLLAEGEQLVRKGSAGCAVPLEAATLAADDTQHTNLDYARALGALGLCREVQGRFGAAHRLVSRALEAAPAETTAAGKADPWKGLREAQRRLDDRVARALVTWPSGAELYVDGEVVAGVSGAVLAVDPGRRLFEARKDGRTLAAQHVEVRAGDLPKVELKASQSSSPPSSTATSSPRTSSTALPSQSLSSPFAPALSPRGVAVTVAYAGFATAVVSGIVAGVLEAQRASAAAGNAPNTCTIDPTSATCAKVRLAYDQSRGARNVALVAGGAGILAAGVGVGLYFGLERGASPTVGATWSGSW